MATHLGGGGWGQEPTVTLSAIWPAVQWLAGEVTVGEGRAAVQNNSL
jgi:hypothetical protein